MGGEMKSRSERNKMIYARAKEIMQNRPKYLESFIPSWNEHCYYASITSTERIKQSGYRARKLWRKKNPDYNKIATQRFNKRHPDYANNYNAKYQKEHPDYWDTDAYRRKNARRQRDLEWVKLFDSIFSSDTEIHYHHISDAFVIPIPKKIHVNNLGQNHREKLKPIIEELYQISYIVVEEPHDK